MKKAAIYARLSPDQRVESQVYDLRKLAAQRGFVVVEEYCDRGMSGSKSRRTGLDSMMSDTRRGRFSVLLVAGFDRVAKSIKNFLEIVGELTALEIEFISTREAIDTSGPKGRMFVSLVRLMAELERSLITERIKAGMRRARLEGQRLGRTPLNIDRDALVQDRVAGMSLTHVAKKYGVSRATVVRFARESQRCQVTQAA